MASSHRGAPYGKIDDESSQLAGRQPDVVGRNAFHPLLCSDVETHRLLFPQAQVTGETHDDTGDDVGSDGPTQGDEREVCDRSSALRRRVLPLLPGDPG